MTCGSVVLRSVASKKKQRKYLFSLNTGEPTGD